MDETDDQPRPGALERSVDNLSAVIKSLLPGKPKRRIHAGAVDGLIAIVVVLVIEALFFAVTVSPQAVSYWEMRGFAGALVFHLIAISAVAVVLGCAGRLPGLVVGTLWAFAIGLMLAFALGVFHAPANLLDWVLIYAFPTLLPAVLFLLSELGLARGVVASLALVASVTIVTFEWAGVQIWQDDDLVSEARFWPDTEAIYGAQDLLLSQQTRALTAGVPGQPELYAVLGAGFPFEKVFRREVEAVSDQLASDFGANGHVIQLINSRAGPLDYPLLNRTNLTAALTAIGAVMNDEDILLLFLTSHGAPGFISTSFTGISTRDLAATEVAAALDGLGDRNAIVIVSACFSGSFIKELAGPERLILTASSDDRLSFGCSSEAEWTDWGRAFFVDALAETRDPREAARIAQRLVSEREVEAGYAPSEPQIYEGNAIGAVLDRWLATID